MTKMTTILRLTGLGVKAGIEDIRSFFENLHVPDGGVYILGGSLQEAFIAFNSEKDAQLALRQTGSYLRGSPVSLYRSSMQEMEHRLEFLLRTRKKNSTPSVRRPKPAATLSSIKSPSQDGNVVNFSPSPASSVDPDTANGPHLNAQDVCSNTADVQISAEHRLDSSTAFLLGVCTVLQGLQSSQSSEVINPPPRVSFQTNCSTADPNLVGPDQTADTEPGYVRLFRLPATTTHEDICHFFKGLKVEETLLNVKLGFTYSSLVKFTSSHDACEALCFNQRFLGAVCVEVRTATEKLWNSVLQESTWGDCVEEREAPQHNPSNEIESHKDKSTSACQMKRKSDNQPPCKPQKKQRFEKGEPPVEQMVMVNNLPKSITKTEIKELFCCRDIPHRNVLHLLDKNRNRTDTAFLTFHREEDYNYALNLSGCHVGTAAIKVSATTKVQMRQMIAENRFVFRKHLHGRERNGNSHSNAQVPPYVKLDSEAQTCIFVRNMPGNVQKSQIHSLFHKYKVTKDNITILHDFHGNGIGEAVVQFESAHLAHQAQRFHGKDFLGSNLLLTLITVNQMEEMLANHQ